MPAPRTRTPHAAADADFSYAAHQRAAGAYFSYFGAPYFSARPTEPSSRHASTTRAAIADSASRPHERGS